MSVRIDLSRSKAQTRAFRAYQPGNTVTATWGRGIGKSWFTRRLWYLDVAEHDGKRPEAGGGVRIVLLMPTLKQAKRVHAALLRAEILAGGEFAFLGGEINSTDWRITFPGGSWVQWVSAENAEANRGIRCDVVCVDETDDIDEGVFDSVVKPWLSEPFSLKKKFLCGTPRRGRHGLLYRMAHTLPKTESNHYSFIEKASEAPLSVDPVYLAEVKRTTPPEIYAREWDVDFDSAEGLVYPHFDERFHVRMPPEGIAYRAMLVGVDHGWEEPGVFLLIGVQGNGEDETYWVLDEVYEPHKVEDWWKAKATELSKREPSARWYPDPARPDRNVALAQAGARIIWKDASAKKAATSNAVEDGVATISNALLIRESDKTDEKRARLYVHPQCVNTIREFGSYRRKRKKDQPIDEVDSSANDHTMDALRYAIHTWRPRRVPGRKQEISDSDFSTG